jgi:hypothetical protein
MSAMKRTDWIWVLTPNFSFCIDWCLRNGPDILMMTSRSRGPHGILASPCTKSISFSAEPVSSMDHDVSFDSGRR